MSDTYSEIKAVMDPVIKNSPPVKIRGGDVHNALLTSVLQHSRDRLGDLTLDLTGLSDGWEMYYDNGSLTWKFRKVIHTETFVVGGTDGTPNWDININHDLNTLYATVTLWDGSGNQKSANGIASTVDADNTRLRLHHAITGTWKVKVTYS